MYDYPECGEIFIAAEKGVVVTLDEKVEVAANKKDKSNARQMQEVKPIRSHDTCEVRYQSKFTTFYLYNALIG